MAIMIHSLFKQVINESVFSKKNENKAVSKKATSVNEASDDDAIGWLTRNNIIPQVFGGEYNGLRVPSAMKPGKKIPFWDKRHLVYPFVGINGYADFPAIEAKHGNEASFMSSRLKSINVDSNVRNILSKQVADGTGIPGNVFLIFPQMPMSSVGTRNLNKSMSLFTTYNKRDSYSNSIYPYNVQQALSVDEKGNLYPNPSKPGGVVLCPIARKAQMASSGIMYADRLREDDVAQMGYLYDRSIFAQQFTGSDRLDFPRVAGLLGSFMSGAVLTNELANGNPKFGKFDEFAKENNFITEDGEIDFIAIRGWILEADSSEIVNKLLIPYLLKSPFEQTYCWRTLRPEQKAAMRDDIAVYNALNGRSGGSFESNLEDVETGSFEFSDDLEETEIGESVDLVFETEPVGMVLEATDDTKSIGGDLSRQEFMAIFDHYVKSHAPTIALMPKERTAPLLRDDGRIKTKDSGVKRTFARILTKNTPKMDIDYKFCPRGLNGLETSYSGVLDYSPLFSQFSEIVDGSMPQRFRYTRIVGYMISFEYDPSIEEAYHKMSNSGKTRNLGLLKYYMESPNSVKLREPTVFDVIYVKGGTYGNFLFSGYATRVNGRDVQQMGGEPPQAVDSDKLFADNVNGLHSTIVHDTERINIQGRYNRSVF